MLELSNYFVMNRLLNKQSASGTTYVPLVEVDTVDDPFNGLIDRGVFENNIGSFTTKFQRTTFLRTGDRLLNDFADTGRSGKRNLVDILMIDDRSTDVTMPGHDVDDARWQIGLLNDFGQFERRQRSCFGRLEHDRVSGRQCRGDFPSRHQQRKVPGDDLAGDTQ